MRITRRRMASSVMAATLVAIGALAHPVDQPVRAGEPTDWQDFNGDTFADLAIGSPFDDVGGDAQAGVVNVIYGSPNGLAAAGDQVWHQDRVPGLGGQGAEPGDHFGHSLAVGDFDGDGFGDLAIGVPDEDVPGQDGAVDLGMVQVLYGSNDGLTVIGAQSFKRGVDQGGQFGFAIVGLDRFAAETEPGVDEFTDLAIGSPGSIRVNILAGSEDGIDLERPGVLFACGTLGSRCGASLAAGDLDGDGRDDLIAGAPDQTVEGKARAGGVRLSFTDPPQVTDFLTEDEVANSSAQAGARFGAAIVIGDVDGDTFPDTFIGAPGRDVPFGGVLVRNAGHVINLPGRAGGPIIGGAFSQARPGIPDDPEAGDAYGSAFAIGNLGGDPDLDLAVGAPGERVGSTISGKVFLDFGATTQTWHQNVAGVLGTSMPGDRFGAALFAADFGRSGRADLAIGVPLGEGPSTADSGEVAVAYGTASGLTADGDQFWWQDSPGIGEVAEVGDRMGTSVR